MGQVTMIKCDNQGCAATELPEEYFTKGGVRKLRPPYGWCEAKVNFQGTGPTVHVVVCCTACLETAVDQAIDSANQERRIK